MRRAIITICFIAMAALICKNTRGAEDRYFYTSGDIVTNEQWNNVFIYNNSTVVNMSGGTVDSIGTNNESTLNITGGWASTVDALDFSIINATGGYVYGLDAYDNGTVTFSANAQALSLGAMDYGTVMMNGGITDYLRAGYNGTVNLYSGTISDSLNAWDSAIVNIYGHDFIYDPYGGRYERGQLRGVYQNGNLFILDLSDFQTYSHINIVPEPTTLLLLGLGVIFIKKKH